MKKLTNIEFISECQKIHNNKYDYSLTNYINARTKINIICPMHGKFTQKAFSHKFGCGCPKCSNNCKLSTLEFIEKSNKIHGDKYDYSLVNYKCDKSKIKIICSEHGIFEQQPNSHIKGNGCPKCSNNAKITISDFIKKSKNIHGDKYDYSLVNYNNIKSKVEIICPEHGIFSQYPDIHIKGHGCSKCSNNCKLSTLEFIEKSNKIHGDKYDYSLVDYKTARIKIKIKCKVHDFVFEQTPNSHLQGRGCPICNESKGENKISNILNEFEIEYVSQKTFSDCKYKKMLPFDFYLPTFNTCIEFDGAQHFKIIEYFGGETAFNENKIRDEIKNEYCKNKKINLIRIKYCDINKIYKIITEKLSI